MVWEHRGEQGFKQDGSELGLDVKDLKVVAMLLQTFYI